MEISEFKNILNVLLVVVVFQGCSTPNYGYSKEGWKSLSEEERVTIKEEYQAIIDSKKKQAHKDIIDARTQSIIDRGVAGPKY